jgi:hypothetical protein
MAIMETYVGIMFVVLLGMVLLFLWLKRKGGLARKYGISEEATEELDGLLARYRKVVAASTESIRGIELLPDSKETIKQYLQIAIGLARLNKEPIDQLLEEYYLLAHFREAGSGERRERLKQEYQEQIANETSVLEKELDAFLKRKRWF